MTQFVIVIFQYFVAVKYFWLHSDLIFWRIITKVCGYFSSFFTTFSISQLFYVYVKVLQSIHKIRSFLLEMLAPIEAILKISPFFRKMGQFWFGRKDIKTIFQKWYSFRRKYFTTCNV